MVCITHSITIKYGKNSSKINKLFTNILHTNVKLKSLFFCGELINYNQSGSVALKTLKKQFFQFTISPLRVSVYSLWSEIKQVHQTNASHQRKN